MKTLTVRGGETYAAFQSAFVATWPKLRAFFAHDLVLRAFKVNLELRRVEGNELKLFGNEHLDEIGL
jgi:hypothetical protein